MMRIGPTHDARSHSERVRPSNPPRRQAPSVSVPLPGVRGLLTAGCLAALLVCLVGCGGSGPSEHTATSTLAITINWPEAQPAGVTPAAIPAGATCVQADLSNTSGWSTQVAATRPSESTTSTLTVLAVPVGSVHIHFGAYSGWEAGDDGAVQATGDLLAWAVTDADVATGQANEVGFTLSDVPARVAVASAGGATQIDVGQQLQMSATAYDAEDNVLAVTGFSWSSSAPTVAQVDANGLVSALAPGLADIEACAGGVCDQMQIKSRGWEDYDQTPETGSFVAVGSGDIMHCFGPSGTNHWYVYTPATKQWAQDFELPEAFNRPAAGLIDGTIYLVGGTSGNLCLGIDPDTSAVEFRADMPSRRDASCFAVYNGELWVIGGDPISPAAGTAQVIAIGKSDAVESYDPATDTWTTHKGFPVELSDAVAGVANGSLYVFGGLQIGSGLQAQAYRYVPGTDSWAQVAALPEARGGMNAAATGGVIYVIGGSTGAAFATTDSVISYDPGADSWATEPSLPAPTAMWNATNEAIVGGYVYVVGSIGQTTTSRVYRFNP